MSATDRSRYCLRVGDSVDYVDGTGMEVENESVVIWDGSECVGYAQGPDVMVVRIGNAVGT